MTLSTIKQTNGSRESLDDGNGEIDNVNIPMGCAGLGYCENTKIKMKLLSDKVVPSSL